MVVGADKTSSVILVLVVSIGLLGKSGIKLPFIDFIQVMLRDLIVFRTSQEPDFSSRNATALFTAEPTIWKILSYSISLLRNLKVFLKCSFQLLCLDCSEKRFGEEQGKFV